MKLYWNLQFSWQQTQSLFVTFYSSEQSHRCSHSWGGWERWTSEKIFLTVCTAGQSVHAHRALHARRGRLRSLQVSPVSDERRESEHSECVAYCLQMLCHTSRYHGAASSASSARHRNFGVIISTTTWFSCIVNCVPAQCLHINHAGVLPSNQRCTGAMPSNQPYVLSVASSVLSSLVKNLIALPPSHPLGPQLVWWLAEPACVQWEILFH